MKFKEIVDVFIKSGKLVAVNAVIDQIASRPFG